LGRSWEEGHLLDGAIGYIMGLLDQEKDLQEKPLDKGPDSISGNEAVAAVSLDDGGWEVGERERRREEVFLFLVTHLTLIEGIQR